MATPVIERDVTDRTGGERQAARVQPGPGLPMPLPRRWREGYQAAAPRWLARVAAVVGLLAVIDGLWPHHWRLIPAFSPMVSGGARIGADATTAVAGLLLLRIAAGLRKRKRLAWLIACIACAALLASDALRGDDRLIGTVGTAVLLVALLAARGRFTAMADPHGRWFAARLAAQFLLVGVGYGLAWLYLPGHVPAATTFPARLREVGLSLVGLGGWLPMRSDGFADTFHATMLSFGLVTGITAVVLALRPWEPVSRMSGDEEARLRQLLDRHGARDSLGYFALRRDKSVVWSATGKAAITYRVVTGVALASGDPIGDPEAWPGAIAAFRELAERFGWTPAVMGCSERGATVFRREYGLTALQLGDEAILRPATFSLEGRAMRGVRQMATRAERAGYTVEVKRACELTGTEIDELRRAAEGWRRDSIERGYSMALGRLGDPADPSCVVVTARHDGALRAFLHLVPWQRAGVSLDLMRWDRNADAGLNELMIVALMRACPALGIEQVSLNFAVFRDALERGARIGAGPVLRVWRRILLVLSRWWQIESLYRFNDKFHPEWQPRFISYPAARDIPRVALAALEAEAFIVRPRLLMRIAGRA